MKKMSPLFLALVVTACAGTYEPASEGPTITLRVEPDIKPGVPLISYSDLTLYLDQMGSSKIEGTNVCQTRSLGWQKIPEGGGKEPFVLPGSSPLKLELAYRTDALFGPALAGSQTYVLTPEAGSSYVMKFWTDKQQFSVRLFRQDQSGTLVPARAVAVALSWLASC